MTRQRHLVSLVLGACLALPFAAATPVLAQNDGRITRASAREVRLANQGIKQLDRLARTGVRQIETAPTGTIRLLNRLKELNYPPEHLETIAQLGRDRIRRVATQRSKQVENFTYSVALRMTGGPVFNPRIEEGFVQALRQNFASNELIMLVTEATDDALSQLDNAEIQALMALEAALQDALGS